MHIQKFVIHAKALPLALALCSLGACDTEGEIDDEVADAALDDAEQEELFRAANDYFDPVGTHDVATCSTLAGWAKDGDTTAATQVHIYKGAPAPYGQIITHVIADDYRGDLPFTDKNHGFSIATPAEFKTGCPERVYIHALDLDAFGAIVSGGNHNLLNLTGKTVTCGPQPPGGCGGPGGPGGPDIPDQ